MSLETKRHSLSHILAQAIKNIYWNSVKLGIWPNIENWFYYDFDFKDNKISDKDLKTIEKEMKKIVKQNQQFKQFFLDINKAIDLLEQLWENYKIQLAQQLEQQWENKISFYVNLATTLKENDYNKKIKTVLKQFLDEDFFEWKKPSFVDMCSWPHVNQTTQIDEKSFKLHKVAGAYWLSDENNPMLTRIYWFAFENKQKLDDYIKFLQEASKRDHRILWKKLGFYDIDPEVGLWLILWKPKWAFIVNTIKRWLEDKQLEAWYIPVITPHIGRKHLWETSGHWWFYNDSMYPPIQLGQSLADYQDTRKPKENEIYLLKPMNCPFHVKIYNSDIHSYKELPIKYYEFWTVYRYEQKWELGWLTRVRWFTQDDAHIICAQTQIEEELGKVVDFVLEVLKHFGFEDIKIYVSLSDPNSDKYVWDKKMWEKAETTIENILKKKNIPYEKEVWEAAFYGPKADFKIKDVLWRYWQLSTVQFDFNLPERFNMYYVDENWEHKQPFMIHRALLGSLERFMWILIEHYAWAFPMWLAYEQIRIIPVSDKFLDYAYKVRKQLKERWFRVFVDESANSLSKKIRNAELEKIPYMIVVWEKEQTENTISVRDYKTKKQFTTTVEKFVKECK